MTAFAFTAQEIALTAVWLAAGLVIGTLYFWSLRRNVGLLAAGRSMPTVMVVQLGRLAAIGIALAAIAGYFGALPLLATTAGILPARALIVRLGDVIQ